MVDAALDPEEIAAFFDESRYFKNIPATLLKKLANVFQSETYAPNTKILKQGDFNEKIYFLYLGKVGIYVDDECIAAMQRKGDIFGEMSIIAKQPVSADIVALEKVIMLTVSAKHMEEVFETINSVDHLLSRIFSRILTDKLFITSRKAKQFEEANRKLEETHRQLEQSLIAKDNAVEELKTFKFISDHSSDAHFFIGMDARFQYVNKTASVILGYSEAELLKLSFLDITALDHDKYHDLFDLAQHHTMPPFESLNTRQDGTTFASEIAVTGYTIDKTTYLFAVLRDISQKKQVEKELQEKQAQLIHAGRLTSLGEMATGVAHELNQPLAIIRSDIQGLALSVQRHTFKLERVEKVANRTIKQVDRAANIINHMRTFARIRSQPHGVISLVKPIQEALSFFHQQFKAHSIEIVETLDDDLPAIAINPQQFEQIVTNFLANARFAVDAKAKTTSAYSKRIELRLFQTNAPKNIVFEIEDNGIGMSVETKERCLDPFFTTKDVGEGTGLGLSIAYGILKECGGSIEIDSTLAIGTTFRIILQIKEPAS